jgi:hypothetical protein
VRAGGTKVEGEQKRTSERQERERERQAKGGSEKQKGKREVQEREALVNACTFWREALEVLLHARKPHVKFLVCNDNMAK